MCMSVTARTQCCAGAGLSGPVSADSDVSEFCELLVKISRY